MAVPPVLERLAPEGARRVALAQLADAAAAEQRVRHATDPEALHDFRVALRRLRSTLRAYEDVVNDTVHRKLRRRLRRAARATGGSRDLEVHAQWVRAQLRRLDRTRRAGARWLLARLERQRAGADRQLRQRALAGWEALHADLTDALGRWTRTMRLDGDAPPPRFAAMAAALVERHADALREALARARADADPDALHQARIAGKRLRYLLEPLGEEIPAADTLVGELKRLQDALGVVQDAHVFAREIAAGVEAAGEERARSLSAEVAREADLDDGAAALDDPLPGLLALARRLGRERAAAQASLERDWLGDDDPAPLAHVAEIVDALRAHAPHDALEVERKYLLRALPPVAAAVAPRRIEQGYLPGTRIAERLRRERRDRDVRCTRTVKDGRGVARIELEEEIAAEQFDRMWPLTAGRRVTKERHPVRDGALTWEVDRFTDRDLVLAEVELTDADARPELPAWLAPYVEREVTGEDAYVNVNLAR